MKPRRKNTPFPLLSFALAMLMLLGAAGCGQDPVDARFAGLAEGTDGASPRDICGLWMSDGAAWAVTASSLARCEDGRSVDFPTYMVHWSPGQEKFYYVQKRRLFSYDPAAEETAEVCKIHRDAHVLAAVTDRYAIAAQERGTACFQVNLDTLEVLPFTAVLETPLDSREDQLLYSADNCLLEYGCKENKSVCLYAPAEEDTRLVSACYDGAGNVLFAYRRGEYRERGTLYRWDRETGKTEPVETPADAAAVCQAGETLLCAGSVWNEENYGELHLYRKSPAGEWTEISLPEALPYTALTDLCRLAVNETRFALACRGALVTGELG